MSLKNKNHGFSLIELVLSLAIMGLLISMVVPQFSNLRDKALDTSVKAAVLTLQTALESYSSENYAYPDGSLDAAALSQVLIADGFLTSPLKNPYTQSTYQPSDQAGKISYTSSDGGASYSLIAYKRDGSTILIETSGGISG